MVDEEAAMGPISYLIVEFPGNKMTGDGFTELIELVERGLIRIVDLEFVTVRDDGSVAALSLHELDSGDFDAAVFEGASSGLLDEADLAEVKHAVAPGASAGILLFENVWATPFVEGMKRGGAELVAAGYIPHADLDAALDATEPG